MISFSKMTAHAWPLASLLLLGSIGGLSADEQATDRVDNAFNDPLPPRTLKLEPLSPETKNRIGLSYRMGLNMTVDFRKFGGLALTHETVAERIYRALILNDQIVERGEVASAGSGQAVVRC